MFLTAAVVAASDGPGIRVLDLPRVASGEPAADWVAAAATRATPLPDEAHFVIAGDRRSLTGRHVALDLVVEGRRVVGSGASVSFDREGSSLAIARVPQRLTRGEREAIPVDPTRAVSDATGPLVVIARERVWLAVESGLIDADQWTIEQDSIRAWTVITERSSGRTLYVSPLFFNASRPARVFPSNPVQRLADPTLLDRNDSSEAVPPQAYEVLLLEGLDGSGRLQGDRVTIADLSMPSDPVISNADDLSAIDRSDPRFEAANAYHLIDSAQRYLESLGYAGAHRIIDRSIEVDPRAFGGADNSFYVARTPGSGFLAYGIGGTDDAEDADIVHHEFGHAIQDAISPGTFGGASASQARALGEGFGDYWAFSAGYRDSIVSGSDPFCLAEWDARCAGSEACAYPAGSACLRRVDSPRTMQGYQISNGAGVEHRNGEIWSSALRRIFLSLVQQHGAAEGRRRSDTLALEGHFGVPPSPTFATVARRMLQADVVLYAGSSRSTLCQSFTEALILTDSDCAEVRISKLFVSGEQRDIPDNDPTGITLHRMVSDGRTIERVFVRVEIAHPQRGDLRLVVVAPDGTPAQLLDTSYADVSAGLSVTFGLDAAPAESLDVFRGRSAAGVWSLRVIDTRARDTGRVLSWALGFQFADSGGSAKRGGTTIGRIPVATSARGATGEWFQSDLAITAGPEGALVELWLGDSNLAGPSRPLSAAVSLEPMATALLPDLVRTLFGTGGGGSIDARILEGSARVGSWITSPHPRGSLRQEIPAPELARTGENLTIPFVSSTRPRRANVGISELGGSPIAVTVRLYSTEGAVLDERVASLDGWEHLQFPVPPDHEGWVAVIAGDGDGAVAAYASIIDSDSGDPSLIPGGRAQSGRHVTPAVASPGAGGSEWRTHLHVAAPAGAELTVSLRDSGGRIVHRAVTTLRAGESTTLGDFITSHTAPGFLGMVELSSASPFAAATRIINRNGVGSSGQLLLPAQAFTRQTLAPWLIDPDSRTNLLMWNEGPRNDVRLIVRTAGGATVREDRITLEQGELRMVALTDPGSSMGRIDLHSVHPLAAWLSIVDNRSGDAVTVSAATSP